MSLIYFPYAAVRNLICITQVAASHRPTYEHMLAEYLKGGSKVTQADLDAFTGTDELDPEKIPGHLQMAKDQGLYLCSSSAEQPRNEKDSIAVVYALGCNPQHDTDWYDTCRNTVGGDDFVVALPLWLFPDNPRMDALTDNDVDYRFYILNFSDDSIEVAADRLPLRKGVHPAPEL